MSLLKQSYNPISCDASFTAKVLLDHLLLCDQEAFEKCTVTLDAEQQQNKLLVMKWITDYDEGLAICLQNIERAWITALDIAWETRDGLVKQYYYTKLLKDQLVDYEAFRPLQVPPPLEQTIAEDPNALPSSMYVSKQQWNSTFVVNDYQHWKDRKIPVHLVNTAIWRTIYNFSSDWDLERALEWFQEHDVEAVGLKSVKIPAQMDMLRWKAVTNENFVEIPQIETARPRRQTAESKRKKQKTDRSVDMDKEFSDFPQLEGNKKKK